ncbi:MAG: hypothetical protein AAGD23_06755 [Pseudomonadota bacterium]
MHFALALIALLHRGLQPTGQRFAEWTVPQRRLVEAAPQGVERPGGQPATVTRWVRSSMRAKIRVTEAPPSETRQRRQLGLPPEVTRLLPLRVVVPVARPGSATVPDLPGWMRLHRFASMLVW